MKDLVVISAHGPDFAARCVNSLPPDVSRLVVDTGSGAVPNADVKLDGGYQTAAARWAYEHTDAEGFLFVQDSMVCVDADPLVWFRDQWAGSGAVAWGQFGLAWDSPEQANWVRDHYGAGDPPRGIVGPVFYTDRASLDRVRWPAIPVCKWQDQGNERAWSFAFAAAGLPVVGPSWDQPTMEQGRGGWRKTWAGRT